MVISSDSEKPPSILFVINSLVAGGAEHVLVEVAGGLAEKGYRTHVLTLQERPDFYRLNPKITRYRCDLMRKTSWVARPIALFARILSLRHTIASIDPTCVVSFMDRVNVFVLPAAGKRPVIISERNNPSMGSSGVEIRILRRLLYRKAKRIVSVSQGVSDSLNWVPEQLKTVIYNPLKGNASDTVMPFNPQSDRKYITAIGRLSPQKGFDTLIRAFAQVVDVLPDWDLVIYGEGSLRAELTQAVKDHNLEDRVFMPGLAPSHKALQAADCFVLSSRFEGFPNVLIEAMQAGLPIVSTDCPYGPGEIINSGENGILVPPESQDAIAEALRELCTSPELRRRLAAAAEKTSQRFKLPLIVDQWSDAILKAMGR